MSGSAASLTLLRLRRGRWLHSHAIKAGVDRVVEHLASPPGQWHNKQIRHAEAASAIHCSQPPRCRHMTYDLDKGTWQGIELEKQRLLVTVLTCFAGVPSSYDLTSPTPATDATRKSS